MGIATRIRGGDSVVEIDCEGRAEPLKFDSLYSALGVKPRTALATDLGVDLTHDGCLPVDAHQRTKSKRVFAAGDVVEALDQISVAIGHAAIAATAIHNMLREDDAASVVKAR